MKYILYYTNICNILLVPCDSCGYLNFPWWYSVVEISLLLPIVTSVSLSVVAELEKKFKSNEQRMQKQRMELDELKENATVVRDEIREQVQKYSNCV